MPLSVGEVTLGEYLRGSGQRLVLAGKTHVMPDTDGPTGEVLSAWHMRHVHLPALVNEAHSETAYMTDQCCRSCASRATNPGRCT